jgi:8-oxo-dGTP diphosphatase
VFSCGHKVLFFFMKKVINNISVDCVIFGFHSNSLKVLLTERKLLDEETGEPIVNDYTLQGHHVLEGENLDDAAARVLMEKTGLNNIFLMQFYSFGDTDRICSEKDLCWTKVNHPNIDKQVFSVGYYSLVDSSKVNPDRNHRYTRWFPINNLPELGYDHHKIIMKALDYLRIQIRREPIAFELLPEKFTLTQMQRLFEAILGVKLDKRNFRKKVSQMKYVISLNEKQNGVAHKPAQVFLFSKEVYEKTKKDKMDFSF